ncbi:MAG: START domain-containing protein [Pseudomonadota bacterium]
MQRNTTKTVRKALLFLISSALALPTYVSASDLFDIEWDLKRDKEGIQVYTGNIEGSKLKAVKSEMRINAPINALIGLVRDADACPEWADLCKKAEHVEVISETQMYVYTLNDLPWPVSDRDAVAHILWEKDAESGHVTMVATVAPDKMPKTKAIRIPYGITQWTFVPHENGEVTVISNAHVDPGGATPAWLTNRLLVDSPFTTMKKMRDIVTSGRYAEATFEFMTN